MARCGCTAVETCNCTVQAGNGVTVSGNGSAANPYVVAIDAIDCAQVRPCISAGRGATYNSTSGVVQARTSNDAGNNLVFGADNGLYVTTNCAQVRACLSEGPGIDYDPATGIIRARPSTDSGNNLIFGGDGGLYVPTGAATVQTDCGISGDGSAGSPLAVSVGTWAYPCDLEDNAGSIYCDSNGVLRGEPRGRATFVQSFEEQDYPSVPIPAGALVQVEERFLTIDNPDPCREAFVIVEAELDVDLTLPPDSGGAYAIGGDIMTRMENRGTSTQNEVHQQGTKAFNRIIPAGGSFNEPFDIRMGQGFGGAVYTRIQTVMRAFVFNL
ncbi:hypothetical protein [Streptomyces parvulus]|uniref:hypothetical protein n=1 Tax=Streptomyces parvulus TaxID=146923 RepID=UPI0037F790F2